MHAQKYRAKLLSASEIAACSRAQKSTLGICSSVPSVCNSDSFLRMLIFFEGLPGSLGYMFSLCEFRDTLLPENFANFGQSRGCEMGQFPSQSIHPLKLRWSFGKSIGAAGGHGPICSPRHQHALETLPVPAAASSHVHASSGASIAPPRRLPHASVEACTGLRGGFSHPWMLGIHGNK